MLRIYILDALSRKLYLILLIALCFNEAYSQDTLIQSVNYQWKHGFLLTDTDETVALRFGGRVFLDHTNFSASDKLQQNFGPLENNSSTQFKSARLYFRGEFYENIEFKMQLEFAKGNVDLKDVYIGLTDIPALGSLRIGHFNEPFRFSTLNSSKFSSFIERPTNSYFSPKRNIGVMAFNDFFDRRVSAQLGAFHSANPLGSNLFTNDGYAVTTRITGLPYVNYEKNSLLHLGGGFSYRKPDSKEYGIHVPIASSMSGKSLTTGIIEETQDILLTNLESVFVHGPISIEAEYTMAQIRAKATSFNFGNYYAQIGWFITGEHRNYAGSYQGFNRINPKRNFGPHSKGAGAWELAVRYEKTDLDYQQIAGGMQSEWTLGVNWYLNPVTRFMMNYTVTEVKNSGNMNTFQARLQIDF